MKNMRKMGVDEYETLMRKRYEFCSKFSKKWQDSGVSAVISPVFPTCSFPAKLADDMGLMGEYLFLWNLLHYPSGVVPVTTVNPEEQTHTDKYNDAWTGFINQCTQKSEGMPLGVQVISHSYEDEKVLAVMQVLESKLKLDLAPKQV
mmetsp:Transcript_11487/g.19442  ORF Transcript_11487/g.19442 Transcript_11487/m.19442 type:complete len:147 (-) Transcript_11487:88-528(-)